jgi:hypothetical protein
MQMRIFLILATLLLFVNPAFSDTVCKQYPSSDGDLPTDQLAKRNVNASVHVVRLVGAGAFSVALQESNIGGSSSVNWVNNGAAITTEGITKRTDVNAQYVRAAVVAPATGTTILVCVYADGTSQ